MTLSIDNKQTILNAIRTIPDYPQKGIMFKDITTMIGDAQAFGTLMKHLHERYADKKIDYVAGIDARGFIFGGALAQMLGCGFVPIRKKGKLPYTTYNEKYALEYGTDEIEIHIDAFEAKENANVLLIDDLIATGGTAKAAANLINKTGANCLEACFIMGLTFLDGIDELSKIAPVYTIIEEA
jgi:adenine phosphoribosyltransferase